MFLTEKDLRETFWKNYNYSGRAIRYQFECPVRDGCADLITVESFQDNIQFNAFEFKLTDIKKAILQAEANAPYVNKSWIVIPSEKEDLIMTKYFSFLKEIKTVGVITVEKAGKWKMIYKPLFKNDVQISQPIIKLMLLEL